MVTLKNLGAHTDKNEKNQKNNNQPQKKTVPGLISRLLYIWTVPLFYYGNRRDLEEDDLIPTKPTYNSKNVGDDLER